MHNSTALKDFFDEKIFQLIVARIEDYAIYMVDPNGYVMSWNKGAEKIKGYSTDEVVGKHISMFYTDEDKKLNIPRQNINIALKNNFKENEGWRRRKDGSLFWANVIFTTLYDDKDLLLGFVVITRDITSQKKREERSTLINAELERRASDSREKAAFTERRFRKLIENSYEGISLLDRDLNVIYRSLSAERINGWNNHDRMEQGLESLVHPDDLAQVKKDLDHVINNPRQPIISTYRALHRKGNYIWLECLLSNRFNDPDINAIVCNFRDVTERIKAEEQVKAKNKQIENILDSITDGFIALDSDFCYTYANRRIGKILGCVPESLLGKNIWQLFPDAVNSATYDAFHTAMQNKHYVCQEDYYAPLNLWQESHIYPSSNGLSVFIRDISERKAAEASLVQSESNLRSIFENTDLAIILFDTQARLVSFNNNARKLGRIFFKTEVEEGVSAFDYCLPERAAEIRDVLERLREQASITYEVSYDINEQQSVWYEVKWVSVLNKEQKPIGTILTLKDITGKKQADLERDRMTADLIQRNKDLEQFTYIVSHNLRAPVANIKGLSTLLSHDNEQNGHHITDELNALATSVNNLDNVILDLNHILQTSNASNDTLEIISLSELVDEVLEFNNHLICKYRATVICNFDEVNEVNSLKGYLYSIFQNLISNSIKYHRSGIDPIIEISSVRAAKTVCIHVKDNGKGIDLARNGQNLYGLYKRFDLSVEGKGMGLFMVKMQVERLGGKITVTSQPDVGTEFKLEFPLM